MQPTLPWLGYFSLINSVDEFIFLDHVQFEKEVGNSVTEFERLVRKCGLASQFSVKENSCSQLKMWKYFMKETEAHC